MTEPLSASALASYLKDDSHCPYCGSGHISGGEIDFVGGKVYQGITCKKCHREWEDEYTLTGITEFEPEEE